MILCTATIKENRTDGSGLEKAITKKYLVNADSFSECECLVNQAIGNDLIEVKSITKGCYVTLLKKFEELEDGSKSEIWPSDCCYFLAKVSEFFMDEKTSIIKKMCSSVIAFAKDIDDARKMVSEEYAMSDITIEGIKKMPIEGYIESGDTDVRYAMAD